MDSPADKSLDESAGLSYSCPMTTTQDLNTSPEFLSVVETAKLLRKALKAAFPGVKFSVRSETYSMGASIGVSWTDGPTEADVDPVAEQFRGARFDGMIDLQTNVSHWLEDDGTTTVAHNPGTVGSRGVLPEEIGSPRTPGARLVYLGADYVTTSRRFSEAFMARREMAAREVQVDGTNSCEQCFAHFSEVGYVANIRYRNGDRAEQIVCSRKCAALRSRYHVRGV